MSSRRLSPEPHRTKNFTQNRGQSFFLTFFSVYCASFGFGYEGISHHLDDWDPKGGHEWPYWHNQMWEDVGAHFQAPARRSQKSSASDHCHASAMGL